MAKKVTIKDIADMAGVSIATVSHVINRTRYVSPDLVKKIENIIIETGYHKKIEEKENRKSTVRPGMFRGFLEVRCRTSLPPRPVWLFL